MSSSYVLQGKEMLATSGTNCEPPNSIKEIDKGQNSR